ncbi:MAG: hypothetical protein ACRCV0_06200 [Brevinema sp.]
MFYILLTLLFGISNSAQAFSYPENVYAFELVPNAIEYFVSPSKNKIKIHRSLDINGQGFYFDVKILLIIDKLSFPYYLKLEIAPDGQIFLSYFGDDVYQFKYPPRKMLMMPNSLNIRESFSSIMGDNIFVSHHPKNDTNNMIVIDFKLGEKNIQIFFEQGNGVAKITAEKEIFTKTTMRIFDEIK